ncbi:LIM domain-binding protein 2 isoform X2 [Lutzomyia longipalpis]|uniref:LIM domain-binding protein 2 isoform X2 n=1 Tax=Lutzomyia longipalpis TaxID=7200 RepID=UPI002483DBA3|nr:LIM domain-binding protein 2 isoform X2 [Lutzomyia longipalpis]
MLGLTRRGVAAGPPLSLPSTLEDSGATWKGAPPGPETQTSGSGGGFTPSGPNSFTGPGSVFPSAGQGSPASGGGGGGAGGSGGAGGGGGGGQTVGGYQGPPPGSNTPQYTASPAPSGSSTPGPGPPQNVSGAGFPPPPNSAGPPYNGPGPGPGGPFGSPSAGGPQYGRPGSSGPAFGGGPHFASPGGPGGFGGPPQFGMPPGSPFGHGPGHPIGPMGPGHMMGGPQPVDRIDQGALSVPRRHTSYFSQTEYRVHELNKRLQQRTEESDNCWWDSFATEFFEDDATLTLTFCLEDGPKRYTIGRTLIPRYFRSIFEGGVTELYFHMKHTKESFHNTSITLDCEQCTMVTHHGKPMFTKVAQQIVCTEGRLILEFMYDDYMRIKSWHMAVRAHKELIPRNVVGMHTHSPQPDPGILEQLTKNITRQGITNSTLNYLRLCVILEPMQELMSRHKAYALSPRDCLKTTLFQKWQRMVAPPEKLPNQTGKKDTQRPANKRRKRKGSNSGGAANNAPPVPSKKRSPGPNFSLASQDVMVVGEPSLMGGEFGDEDERLITRLENTQYDAANSLEHDNHGGFHADSPMTGPNSWNVDRGGPQGNTPSSQDSEKKSPAVSQ